MYKYTTLLNLLLHANKQFRFNTALSPNNTSGIILISVMFQYSIPIHERNSIFYEFLSVSQEFLFYSTRVAFLSFQLESLS